MTDPTFETWAKYLEWEQSRAESIQQYKDQSFALTYVMDIYDQMVARVRAAHAHLMPKGNDDAK